MTDVQKTLRDVVTAGPPGYHPPGDPYQRVLARARSRRRHRVAAVAVTVVVAAGGGVVLPSLTDRLSGRQDRAVATAPAVVEGRFTFARVLDERGRVPSDPCPAGTLPDAENSMVCFRLDGDDLAFVARARVVADVSHGGDFSQWVVRLDLPAEATRALRQWSAGTPRPQVALVCEGRVLHAPLFAAAFSGTTWDVAVQDRAAADALLQQVAD